LPGGLTRWGERSTAERARAAKWKSAVPAAALTQGWGQPGWGAERCTGLKSEGGRITEKKIFLPKLILHDRRECGGPGGGILV